MIKMNSYKVYKDFSSSEIVEAHGYNIVDGWVQFYICKKGLVFETILSLPLTGIARIKFEGRQR